MKTIMSKMLLCTLILMPFGQTISAIDPVVEPTALIQILKDPKIAQALTEALQKIKEVPADTIGGNFAASGQGFIEGFQGLGLGISRLVRECSHNFRDLGVSAAKHYWVLGGALATGALFYMYVLPRIKFRIEFSSDHNPHVNIHPRDGQIIRIANANA